AVYTVSRNCSSGRCLRLPRQLLHSMLIRQLPRLMFSLLMPLTEGKSQFFSCIRRRQRVLFWQQERKPLLYRSRDEAIPISSRYFVTVRLAIGRPRTVSRRASSSSLKR